MNLSTYQTLATRTVAPPLLAMELIGGSADHSDLVHAQLGLSSEVGELADAMKKAFFYGRPLDTTNIAEEIGDILWYLSLAATSIGMDLGVIAEANIAKLEKRYPEKFADLGAQNRNIEEEHKLLDEKLNHGSNPQ